MKKQFLEAGRIVRTHGVRGELCLEPWADSAEFLAQVEEFFFDSQAPRGCIRDVCLLNCKAWIR